MVSVSQVVRSAAQVTLKFTKKAIDVERSSVPPGTLVKLSLMPLGHSASKVESQANTIFSMDISNDGTIKRGQLSALGQQWPNEVRLSVSRQDRDKIVATFSQVVTLPENDRSYALRRYCLPSISPHLHIPGTVFPK